MKGLALELETAQNAIRIVEWFIAQQLGILAKGRHEAAVKIETQVLELLETHRERKHLDHITARDVHPANLLPTCVACNRSFKLASDPLVEFGAGQIGDVFLPCHRPAFGPLTVCAERQSNALRANIADPSNPSKRRDSLCRVLKLEERWTDRLGILAKECDDQLAGWPAMMQRIGGRCDRPTLGSELAIKATEEHSYAKRRESALLRRAYYEFLTTDAGEFNSLCQNLGL